MATDVGGDGKYVTTTITALRFHEDAVVKLVRPGYAEYEPVTYRVVSSTKIIATFDLTGAPHGLYDVRVTNPDGAVDRRALSVPGGARHRTRSGR